MEYMRCLANLETHALVVASSWWGMMDSGCACFRYCASLE